jgi:integrase
MSPRTESFPLVIRAGSSVVKIYRDRKPSRDYFRVVYHLGGRRHRLNFRDLEHAKTEAQAKAAQLARGDVDAAQLSGRDRLVYGRALEAIREHGIPLDAVAHEYSEARKILDGHSSVVDAARFYMRHNGRGGTDKPVADAVASFIEAKRNEGRSELYLKDLRGRLGAFVRSFALNVRQLAADDVRDYLAARNLSATSRNNNRRVLQTFFGFCQSRGWLSREALLLDGVGKYRGATTPIGIFTPAELRVLLHVAPPKLAGAVAVQAFGGIRAEEMLRLTWADLERRKGFIEVGAGKAKTAKRRLIPIPPNLAQWLLSTPRGNSEKVWPHTKSAYFHMLSSVAKRAGVGWKQNGLRHSFISYRLAAKPDIAAVAIEAGNSPSVIFQHYRELAVEAEALEWFAIVPADRQTDNVLRFAS